MQQRRRNAVAVLVLFTCAAALLSMNYMDTPQEGGSRRGGTKEDTSSMGGLSAVARGHAGDLLVTDEDVQLGDLRWWRTFMRKTQPAGFDLPVCRALPKIQNGERFTTEPPKALETVPSDQPEVCDGSREKLFVPRMTEAERRRLQSEVLAQFAPGSKLPPGHEQATLSKRRALHTAYVGAFRGIRILSILGRERFTNITLRAVRRMLQPYGGLAIHVTFMMNETQAAKVDPLIAALGLPESIYRVIRWGPDVDRADYRRLYTDVEDGYLHLKLDDDLVFLSHDLELTMSHTFFFPTDYSPRRRKEIHMALRSKAPLWCELVSANVVNHNWAAALHHQIGAIDLWIPRPLRINHKSLEFSDYAHPAVWAAEHRSFLAALASLKGPSPLGRVNATHDHRSYLQRFDFGVHDRQCDTFQIVGQEDKRKRPRIEKIPGRRWSINAFLFPWSRNETASFPHGDDERYITMEMPFKAKGRGAACMAGSSVVSHFRFIGQKTRADAACGLTEAEDSATLDRLVAPYRDISLAMDGVRPCCRESGCKLFTSEGMEDDEALSCATYPHLNASGTGIDYERQLQCRFPFNRNAGSATMADFLRGIGFPARKSRRAHN